MTTGRCHFDPIVPNLHSSNHLGKIYRILRNRRQFLLLWHTGSQFEHHVQHARPVSDSPYGSASLRWLDGWQRSTAMGLVVQGMLCIVLGRDNT